MNAQALTFVTMRQHHYQTAGTAPFHFTGTDELIDHYLRTVSEIAELCFPDSQCIWLCCGITIFKASTASSDKTESITVNGACLSEIFCRGMYVPASQRSRF
jgi:hypothetical protein